MSKLHCGNCGGIVLPKDLYCIHCGSRLSQNDAVSEKLQNAISPPQIKSTQADSSSKAPEPLDHPKWAFRMTEAIMAKKVADIEALSHQPVRCGFCNWTLIPMLIRKEKLEFRCAKCDQVWLRIS